MAAKEGSRVMEAHPMNGGNDSYSYANNSSAQRDTSVAASLLVSDGIAQKLNITTTKSASNTFCIADMGCSVGPNTFFVVQNIIEAVETKYKLQGLDNNVVPEFQVFFSDHTSNDFNTLFNSLPTDRCYFAAGVPGSFHDRIFPNASLHFVYSSFSLQWLSNVPKHVADKSSSAWNKGRIYYSSAKDEVITAYSNQHAEDMGRFLNARAAEVASGGLMVLIIPGRINRVPHSHVPSNIIFDILGDSLMDMAKKGIIEESKVDSLNVPIYLTSLEEVEEAIKRNGSFSIERMESVGEMRRKGDMAKMMSMHVRAGVEGLIKKQFGSEIIEDLFGLYTEKLEVALSDVVLSNAINLFFLLKRREH